MKPIIENVPKPFGRSFAQLSFVGKAFDCPYHSHPEIEILRIVSSRGRFLVGASPGNFSPDDFFLFGPNLAHLFQNEVVGHRHREKAESHYIQFLPDCLGAGFFKLPEMRRIRALLNASERGLYFPASMAGRLVETFENAFRSEGPASVCGLLSVLLQLSRMRWVALAGSSPRISSLAATRLGRALDLLHRKFRENVSLTELARAAGMEPCSFSRSFRRSFGICLQEYLTRLRLEESRRLLVETDMTIAEAAFASGFCNLSNFNRHFKKLSGRSPRSFRTDATSRC